MESSYELTVTACLHTTTAGLHTTTAGPWLAYNDSLFVDCYMSTPNMRCVVNCGCSNEPVIV